jgi:hypothetical protein
MPAGRPSSYTPELADELCSRIASPMSLGKACEPEGMPSMSTVFKWLREIPDFSQRYAKACEERTEAQAEEMLDIADDGRNDFMASQEGDAAVVYKLNGEAINRSRLRVDTRKWLMAKMKPKKYGDKIHTEHSGTVSLEGLITGANEPDQS